MFLHRFLRVNHLWVSSFHSVSLKGFLLQSLSDNRVGELFDGNTAKECLEEAMMKLETVNKDESEVKLERGTLKVIRKSLFK